MIINEKNEGKKIEYEVKRKKITFDDDLTINLEKRQEDWPVHIDICFDDDGALVIGAAAGRSYVAEIDIPKREYIIPEDTETAEDGGMGDTPQPEPVPLDMDAVTLSLWAVA